MDSVQTPRRQRRLRRRGAVVLLGLGAFGLAAASAASLGGLTSATLGADNGAVTSCDTDGVTLAYTNAYNATSGLYETTTVTVSGMNAACTGKTISITLASASASLGGVSGVAITGTSQAFPLTTAANAKLVTQAAVVITG